MKYSHLESHIMIAGTLIHGRDAEVKHEKKNHEVRAGLAFHHEAESAEASRPDVFSIIAPMISYS